MPAPVSPLFDDGLEILEIEDPALHGSVKLLARSKATVGKLKGGLSALGKELEPHVSLVILGGRLPGIAERVSLDEIGNHTTPHTFRPLPTKVVLATELRLEDGLIREPGYEFLRVCEVAKNPHNIAGDGDGEGG